MLLFFVFINPFDPVTRQRKRLHSLAHRAWQINKKIKEFEKTNTEKTLATISSFSKNEVIDSRDYDFLTAHNARYHAPSPNGKHPLVRLELFMLNKRFLCFSDGSVIWIYDTPEKYETMTVDEFCEKWKGKIDDHFRN